MSLPRQIIPGATYAIDRRCFERRFFLRPDSYVTQVFLYCLAYAAMQCGILLHTLIVLSNHFHLDLTDPDGRLPEFMQRFDAMLARALNAYRTFARPKGRFFDPDGRLPETVELTLTPPPGFEHLSDSEMTALLHRHLIERETEIRAKFKSEGRTFLGMDGVMRCDPNDRPRTREPRRKINPRIAAADREERIEAIEHRRTFLCEYRAAWLRWRAGDRDVVFPSGTYLMRVRHHARCRPPPPS